MTHEGISWLVILGSSIQLTGLAVILAIGFRWYRELVRLGRVTGAFINQESEKTRARMDELFGPHTR